MFDVALASAGAQVILATSSDENFPPENMIDGSTETFWATTGLFPQEFVISFQSLMNIDRISINSYNVAHVEVARSVQHDPVDFEPIGEKEFDQTDSQLQNEDISVSGNITATHIRFTIDKSFDHFCSVHKVHVNGNAVHN